MIFIRCVPAQHYKDDPHYLYVCLCHTEDTVDATIVVLLVCSDAVQSPLVATLCQAGVFMKALFSTFTVSVIPLSSEWLPHIHFLYPLIQCRVMRCWKSASGSWHNGPLDTDRQKAPPLLTHRSKTEGFYSCLALFVVVLHLVGDNIHLSVDLCL